MEGGILACQSFCSYQLAQIYYVLLQSVCQENHHDNFSLITIFKNSLNKSSIFQYIR